MGLLDDKVAVITGSGRGVGRAIAEGMTREGARIVINDLDKEPAYEVADILKGKGAEVAVCVGSLTDTAFPNRLIETALETFGRLDILVNNTGYTWDGVQNTC